MINRGCIVAAARELRPVPTSNPLLFRARVAQLRAARRLSDGVRRPPFASTRRAVGGEHPPPVPPGRGRMANAGDLIR